MQEHFFTQNLDKYKMFIMIFENPLLNDFLLLNI
jgi:hypothetical protein